MFKALAADEYQPADDPTIAAAESEEKKTRDDLAAALHRLAEGIPLLALIGAIKGGDWSGVSNVIPLRRFDSDLANAMGGAAEAHGAAGDAAAADIVGPAPISFDRIHAATVEALQRQRLDLVEHIDDGIRQTVLAAIKNGLAAGHSPEQIGAAIKETIGLAPKQAAAVNNYRRMLEMGDRQVLRRVLRDKTYDAGLRRLLDAKQVPDLDKVDSLVERYAARMREHRAETIARTETLSAAVAGTRAAYEQAAERFEWDRSKIRRFWQLAADERVCPVCRSIASLNANGVGMDEPFASIQGPVMASPVHTSCRCTIRYEVNNVVQPDWSRAPLIGRGPRGGSGSGRNMPNYGTIALRDIAKEDPYRDEHGRFASGPGGAGPKRRREELRALLAGEIGGHVHVAKLPSDIQSHLGAKTGRVILSAESVASHREEDGTKHKWTVEDFDHLQRTLNRGEVRTDGANHVVVAHDSAGWWKASIKVANGGKEVYLNSFFPIKERRLAAFRRKGDLVRSSW